MSSYKVKWRVLGQRIQIMAYKASLWMGQISGLLGVTLSLQLGLDLASLDSLGRQVWAQQESKDAAVTIAQQDIARFDTTNAGRQKMLETIFSLAKSNIETHVKDLALPDITQVSKDPDCVPEKIKSMEYADAWRKCAPGIPDYFMKDGSSWRPSISPRPVRLEIKNSKIHDIQFGDVKVNCQGLDCELQMSIKELSASTNFEIINVFESSKFKADESLLKFHPFKMKLKQGNDQSYPTLRVKLKLNATNAEGKGALSIDPDASSIYLPTGSLQVDIPENGHNVPLHELINRTNKICINATIMSLVCRLAGATVPSITTYTNLIDLYKSINGHFDDKDKMNEANSLINSLVVGPQLKWINEAIKSAPIFQGLQVELPNMRIQDFFDYKDHADALGAFDQFLNDYHPYLQGESNPSANGPKSFQDFRYRGLDLDGLLQGPAQSANASLLSLLDKSQSQVLELSKDLQEKIQSLKSKGADAGHWQNEEQLVKRAVESLERTKEQIKQRAQGQQKLIHIKMLLEQMGPALAGQGAADLLRLHLRQLGPEGVASHPPVCPGEAPQEDPSSQDSREPYDVGLVLNFQVINDHLKKLQSEGQFNFCLQEQSQALESGGLCSGSGTISVSVPNPPQIKWDENRGHYFELVLRPSAQLSRAQEGRAAPEDMSMKVFFHPRECGEGKLCFDSQMEMDSTLLSMGETAKVIGQNFMKSLFALIPWLKSPSVSNNLQGVGGMAPGVEFAPADNGKVRTPTSSFEFPVPGFVVKKVENTLGGFKLFAEVQQEK